MDSLLAARAQMEVSLGFHMIFSAIGIALPIFMCIAEGLHLRTGQAHYRELARKWGKATSLLFAIGAVSGTALSFELGLLWPRFMAFAGAIIGSAFALEGYAFFIEAIFIGLYLYGWERLSPRAHWLSGLCVAVSGTMSGVLVIAANAWMQVPGGFVLEAGRPAHIDPLAPFKSPAWLTMSVHTTLAAYIAVGFAIAGIYALGLIRGRKDAYHRSAISIALVVAACAALAQVVSGDVSARMVAKYQPVKLAAMEAHYVTSANAPLVVGGLVDDEHGEVRHGLKIPSGLSLLIAHDPEATIPGLDRVPRTERPPVAVVHAAFDVMVTSGFALAGLGCWFGFVRLRRKDFAESTWLLRALVVAAPLGFVALEAGWAVAEVGRQPWVIDHVMRTADAVTPAHGVPLTFFAFCVLYALLGTVLVVLLRALATGPAEPAHHAE
jgi:cytochrome d ubiquinol oxidase subunit I